MIFFKKFENYNSRNWKILSTKGTEAIVYTDDKWAYRVVNGNKFDFKYLNDKIKKHVGKNYKNTVFVKNIWFDERVEEIIIQMELLDEIDISKIQDKKEFYKISDIINDIEDDPENLPVIIKSIKDQEIKKMVESIYNSSKELEVDRLDIGFHNLMYDPNTKEYKQIDYF